MSIEKFDLEAAQQLLSHIEQHLYDMREIGQSIRNLYEITSGVWKDDKAYEFYVYMENILGELSITYGLIEEYHKDLSNHIDKLTK